MGSILLVVRQSAVASVTITCDGPGGVTEDELTSTEDEENCGSTEDEESSGITEDEETTALDNAISLEDSIAADEELLTGSGSVTTS